MDKDSDQRPANDADHGSEPESISSPKVKPATSAKPYHLTPLEIESLRQEAKRTSELARAAFRNK